MPIADILGIRTDERREIVSARMRIGRNTGRTANQWTGCLSSCARHGLGIAPNLAGNRIWRQEHGGTAASGASHEVLRDGFPKPMKPGVCRPTRGIRVSYPRAASGFELLQIGILPVDVPFAYGSMRIGVRLIQALDPRLAETEDGTLADVRP